MGLAASKASRFFLLWLNVCRHAMLPIGDICNLKSLICSFLKLLRDVVNFQMLHIGKNNFKSLQLWTFHCIRFKKIAAWNSIKIHCILLLWGIFIESGILALILGILSLGFDVKALIPQGLTRRPNYFGFLNNLMTLIICESLREMDEMACVTSAWSSRGQTLNYQTTLHA